MGEDYKVHFDGSYPEGVGIFGAFIWVVVTYAVIGLAVFTTIVLV
jgi:hypothetical protein